MADEKSESPDRPDTLTVAADRLKDIYGDRCRILRQMGDYELLIKVDFPQKLAVHVAVPNSIQNMTQVDILLRGCSDPELQTQFDTAMRTCVTSSSSLSLDDLFSLADQWIQEHVPIPSTTSSEPAIQPKKPSKPKKSSKNDLEDEPSSKKPSMKTAADVISRLQWDSELKPENFLVGYLDRFTGIIEKPFSEFNWSDDFVDVDLENDFAVPQHRIQYFKYKTAIVWDKKERLDAIFNSGGCRASLENIMRQEDDKE